MSLSTLSYSTGGLYPNLPNYAPLLAGGSPVFLNPTPVLNPSENPASYGLTPNLNLSPAQIADLQSISTIKNLDGQIIVPTPDGFMSMGEGYSATFDPQTLQGRIQPALATSDLAPDPGAQAAGSAYYTGSDIRLMIESSEASSDGRRYAKQLMEATTITISVHREVVPVRAGGYINPKGFALGKRTIAGTLILTQSTVEVLYEFLQSIMVNDGSKDTFFTKVDQLPPFNITMIFTNEYGYASERKLLGVKFVTDGVVYSVQDMLTEQTLSYMATDFTPLSALTLTSLYQPSSLLDQTTRRERSPMDLMQRTGPSI